MTTTKVQRIRPPGGMRKPPWGLAIIGIVLVLGMHFIGPLLGAGYAFTDWDGFSDPEFIGFANFAKIWNSPIQRGALVHTLILAGAFVVLVNIIGLALAVALNRTLKSRNFLRTLFFAPAVLSPLAISYVWLYILGYTGTLNSTLTAIGLGGFQHDWLGDPSVALWMILVVMLWQFSGQAMIIYLAGLQGVAEEYEEAAMMDGAGAWRRFRKITLPLLAPAFTVVTTLTLIMGLRVFDQVYALTGGGPVYATETLSTQVYQQTFVLGEFGFGAALALIMTLLITVLGITNLLFQRRRERKL